MSTRTRLTVALLAGALAAASSVGLLAHANGLYPVGTDPSSVDLQAAAETIPYEEGWAIPLKGARPSWYTADIEEQVRRADGAPVLAPKDAPLPSEVGIRPGSWMIAPAGCTMNFIFSKGSRFAIGTAGHCVDERGQSVVLLTLAPGRGNPVLVTIGSVLTRRDNGIGDDFALVSVRPELNSWVSPTTALIGGPCGAYYGSGPETVWHYGHGLAIGTGGTPRAGVSVTWKQDAYGWDGAAIFGDSGSPVRVADFKAAGNLTHLVVDRKWLPSFIAGTRIGKILQSGAKGWSLASSPLCP